MNSFITFYLNDQEYKTIKNLTLFEVIKYFNYLGEIFVIEHNKTICNKKNWNTIKLKNNDTIEIITIVGGG